MRLIHQAGLAVLLALLLAASADAAQLKVCTTGCTYTDPQAAINAAVAGDEILLETNHTYAGQFTLPAFTCAANDVTCYITIRTGVTSTGTVMANSSFPAANIRITPSYASVLAKFQPTVNNGNAIGTLSPPTVTKWWHLKWLEFVAGTYGGAALLRFGNDSNTVQTKKAEVPGPFWVEQIYLHGDPIKGQYRGMEWHSNDTTMQDSYFANIKSQDEGQSILFSGFDHGGLLQNNYLEGGAETTITGGTPCCGVHHGLVQAAPAPTVNGATLSTVEDLVVGQGMSIVVGGLEQFVEVATIVGSAITWTPALNAVPDVPGNTTWGITPTGVTVTKNIFTRQLAWRNPIVGTPQGIAASATETGGTLAAGTYAYRVVARMATNNGETARSGASSEVTAAITGTTGSVTITWAAVTNAETYYVYGRSVGGENVRFSVTAPTVTFTDTGASGVTENVPTSSGNVWATKNIFELKNADGWTIEGNIFENIWKQAQRGDAVLFTPANTGGGNDSTHVANMTFRNNIIRHAAGIFQVTCRDVGSTNPSGRTHNIQITNNLSYDINGPFYGGADRIFYISKGGATQLYPDQATNPSTMACKDITVDHNTWDQTTTQNSVINLDMFSTVFRLNEHLVWTNNITVRGVYGMTGSNGCVIGNDCWTKTTDAASVWSKNVVADAACSAYPSPTTNFCPTSATLQTYYTDFAGNDFRLKSTSPYHNAALDGTDIGANIPAILAFTNIAQSGDNSGTPPPPPPVITTASIPQGSVSTAYSVTLTANSCGTGCTWTLLAGTLPTGITLSAGGVLSGVTTTAVQAQITVQAQASGGLTATKDFTLQILAPTPDISNRPVKTNYQENGTFVRADEPSLDPTTDSARVADVWFDLTHATVSWLCGTAPTPQWCEFVQKVNGSAIASLGATGTPSSLTYLRGDNTWAVPAGGGTSTVPFLNLMFVVAPTSYQSWSAGNNATTEFSGALRNRVVFDLTGYTQCRIYTRIGTGAVGPTSVNVYPQYSTNNGSTWTELWGTTPSISLMASSTTGQEITAFTAIAAGAKADVLLRVVATTVGTVTTQPTVGNVGLNCK